MQFVSRYFIQHVASVGALSKQGLRDNGKHDGNDDGYGT